MVRDVFMVEKIMFKWRTSFRKWEKQISLLGSYALLMFLFSIVAIKPSVKKKKKKNSLLKIVNCRVIFLLIGCI